MTTMNALRALVGLLAVVMAVAIAWAWGAGHFLRELEVMIAMPWGAATLLDLYICFALIAVVILLVERVWWRALLWIAPLPFLGSLWAAIWFVARLPRIAQLLDPNRGPIGA